MAGTARLGRAPRGSAGALDLVLLAIAVPLAWRAQRVVDTPLHELVARLARPGVWPARDPERVTVAAGRATARWGRWFGGINSCLTRSLVAGSMLAACGDVVLHVGFRPGEGDRAVDGHAWITVRGEPVGADGRLAGERFSRIVSVPFTARGG